MWAALLSLGGWRDVAETRCLTRSCSCRCGAGPRPPALCWAAGLFHGSVMWLEHHTQWQPPTLCPSPTTTTGGGHLVSSSPAHRL